MIDTILRRRSIRDGFEHRPVSAVTLERILACGLAAPSSKNAQPWRMHVVQAAASLGWIADAVQAAKHAERYVPVDPARGVPREEWPSTVVASAEVLRQAAVGIFVENQGTFSDGRRTVAQADADTRENALVGFGLEMIGLGAAVQNMWLAAEDSALAGVFMGDVVIAEAAIRSKLGMAGDLVGVLALAHSSGQPPPRTLASDRVVKHD